MILVDTNVISELMKPRPSQTVVEWFESTDPATVFVSTVTIAEIVYGLNLLPQGKRRQQLTKAFQAVIAEAFSHRIISFDEAAASMYGELMAQRQKMGRPMAIGDCQIAAIASARGYILATRNVRDFEDCGLTLVNPFL